MEVIVFTNGCFDILHPGHVELLEKAKELGTKLIVGINSDRSVKAIKGSDRPIVSEKDRAAVLMGLKAVDEVLIFNEPTPQQIIEKVRPDVLVKGGDWKISEIVGASFVQQNGGKVFSIPLKQGFSTSAIVEKINAKENKNLQTLKNSLSVSLEQHQQTIENLFLSDCETIKKTAEMIYETLKEGKQICFCLTIKNYCFAQNFISELEKIGLETGNICINYQKGLENIENLHTELAFERLTKESNLILQKGDLLIGISETGLEDWLISETMQAREAGCYTFALTGKNGKKLTSLCDQSILISSDNSHRIQEAIATILNLWIEIIEVRRNEI